LRFLEEISRRLSEEAHTDLLGISILGSEELVQAKPFASMETQQHLVKTPKEELLWQQERFTRAGQNFSREGRYDVT
jgi:hypothetical protein